MDPVMQTLFGKMPISQLTAVQAALSQKSNTNKILILGAIIIVGGVIVHHINKENQELRIKLKALTIKHRE